MHVKDPKVKFLSVRMQGLALAPNRNPVSPPRSVQEETPRAVRNHNAQRSWGGELTMGEDEKVSFTINLAVEIPSAKF